jgi:hypothetical protein
MDDVEDIKDDFLYNFPRLKENGEELEELIQAMTHTAYSGSASLFSRSER